MHLRQLSSNYLNDGRVSSIDKDMLCNVIISGIGQTRKGQSEWKKRTG